MLLIQDSALVEAGQDEVATPPGPGPEQDMYPVNKVSNESGLKSTGEPDKLSLGKSEIDGAAMKVLVDPQQEIGEEQIQVLFYKE